MSKKLLLGAAIAAAFCTASYAEDASPQVEYRFHEAQLTYNDAMNTRCRTGEVASAIWSLENDVRSIDDWLAEARAVYVSIGPDDSSRLLAARNRVGAQMAAARYERDLILAWLDTLRNLPPCAMPDPPVPAIPGGSYLHPILVATDFTGPGSMAVIWIDEQGNQYYATYDADGAGRWDGHGAAPERPKAEDVLKAHSLSGDEFRRRQELKIEKQSSFMPSNDGEKRATKSNGNSEHSNAKSFHIMERTNSESLGRSGEAPQAIKFDEPAVSRGVDHANNAGGLNGMAEARMHGGGQLAGFRGAHFGHFGR